MSEKIDLNNHNHRLIIAGLVGMIEDEGKTIHEVAEVYEDIKRQIFPSLMEIQRERVKN